VAFGPRTHTQLEAELVHTARGGRRGLNLPAAACRLVFRRLTAPC
jgi:hypothetical protein